MSNVNNKPGESWTVLNNENDVTYSLPIFLGVGKTITKEMDGTPSKEINDNNSILFHNKDQLCCIIDY